MADFGQDIQHRAREIKRIITEARTELYSDDYAVKVVVGPAGAVLDVELTSRASKYSGAELGELILEQLKLANQQMNTELSEQLAGLMGDSPMADPRKMSSLPSADEVRRIREENNKRDTTEEY